MSIVPQRANFGSIPPEVIRFERRVARINQLPPRLRWVASPLTASLARLQTESLNAAERTSNMARRRHTQICEDGGYALVNGCV